MTDSGNGRPLVLAVDDDQTVLDEVSGALLKVNFACRCCTTSQEALLAAQTTIPDLILCDVNLNGESGMDLCQRIKQQPDLQDVPVMFLSGVQLPDVIRRNFNVGGTYCLRKPFAPTVLIELIDQALGVTEV